MSIEFLLMFDIITIIVIVALIGIVHFYITKMTINVLLTIGITYLQLLIMGDTHTQTHRHKPVCS